MSKTKQEKREELARKRKIKTSKGGTLAGQFERVSTARKYTGSAKQYAPSRQKIKS